ncbi:hypothetical protein SAMN04487949_1931 [Halogranum gelatinilyticum]|uniref:LWR-salt protein n=1 Tax=Halogranum gelatinilyticum TaxID=660521 RepID=A0A1G9TVH4_9EURY|nr:LWR-salt protein [Halogranum gelatinilyticum]SDM51739.1 hypothetical protein SAMN04487949_1931 [Halogranum gelatinilyticum]
MNAAYVFRVRFRLDASDVRLDPQEFETVLRLPVVDPDDEDDPDGWLFFRDNLWRGDAADERHLRTTASDLLGVDVTSVHFSELATDRASLERLREAIASDLEEFNADSVDEVLHKYLGSSIRVTD